MDRETARRRAKALAAKMSLEEKAGQLSYTAPPIPRLGVPAYNWWNEALHGVARSGTATSFPRPSVWRPCLTMSCWKSWGM